MGREVRMVPKDWQHPKNERGHYIPLFGRSFKEELAAWRLGREKWGQGLRKDWFSEGEWKPIEPEHQMSWEEWTQEEPKPEDYMPEWPAAERTHFMMYEDTSEGTPISPAFEKPEDLARWLADNRASAFGGEAATYEQWLATINRGSAVSAVLSSDGLVSGVAALGDMDK